jgi:RecA-family ATPase
MASRDLNGYDPSIKVTKLVDVVPETLEWLWPSRIPRAMVSLLVGDPDEGKSYTSLDITARVTTGSDWPDDTGSAPKGRVLLVSAEDDLARTIRPRLDKLGADPRRVRFIELAVQRGDKQEFLSLKHHLDQVVDELQRVPTALMVIDPISAFVPGVDTHNDSEVRLLMARLTEAAKNTNCAILCIKHLNKARGEYNSLYRVGGSLGFVAAARSVLLATPHPHDAKMHALSVAKSNLCAKPDSLAYSITDDGLVWGDTFVYAADDLLIHASRPKAVDEAKKFLAGYLANKSAPASEVQQEAKDLEIGLNALNKAKAELGVVTKRQGGRDGHFVWSLPVSVDSDAKS